jgi:hypothetical protein
MLVLVSTARDCAHLQEEPDLMLIWNHTGKKLARVSFPVGVILDQIKIIALENS